MQVREKVAKSRNTMFFQWFVAPEGRKVGSLKWRLRSLRDEKLHAVVARSTFPSQSVQNTPCSKHFWKLRCRKSAHRSGAKHVSKSKCSKHPVQGIVHTLSNVWAKHEGCLAFPKTMARVGHLKRVWKDAFSMAGAIQETCSSEMLGGQARALISWGGLHFGASDLQFWEDDIVWQVQHFVWPGITFSYFIDMDWKNRKTHWYEAVSSAHLCTQLSTIEGSLAELLRFWCCQLQKFEEVSQNCFVFHVANFKNWGSLAE